MALVEEELIPVQLRTLRRLDTGPSKDVRLIAFPYAGGGAHLYQSLATSIGNVELWAAEYAGHGTRISEPLLTGIPALAEDLIDDMRELSDLPMVFLGYSMGAIVAFEAAQLLGAASSLRGLVVCAARPPGSPTRDGPSVASLDDAQLTRRVLKLGGTPPALLEHPELLELFLPVLRADFLACERYQCRSGTRLALPIVALRGAGDEGMSGADVEGWARFTTGSFHQVVVEGSHFFLNEAPAPFADRVRDALAVVLATPKPSA